jgi:hypothetical protein
MPCIGAAGKGGRELYNYYFCELIEDDHNGAAGKGGREMYNHIYVRTLEYLFTVLSSTEFVILIESTYLRIYNFI